MDDPFGCDVVAMDGRNPRAVAERSRKIGE